MNCPKFFKQTRPNKKFCSTACKDQFNKFGGAYGKLKEKLFAEISKEIRRQLNEELPDIKARLDSLEVFAENSTREINTCLGLIVRPEREPVPADVLLKARTASPEAKSK